MAGFFLLVLRAVIRSRRMPLAVGPQALVGRIGIATSDLMPSGMVVVDREPWSAHAVEGAVERGASVRVIAVEGVTLKVARLTGDSR